MSDPDPTLRDDGASAASAGGMTPAPAPAAATAGAVGAAEASVGAATSTAPAAPTAPASASAAARWTAVGANGQLAVIGAAIVLGSYILGALLSGWDLSGLAHILVILAAIAAIAIVLVGTSALPAPARAIALRVAAGTAAAYAAIDLGDMMDDLSTWGVLDIVLTITTAIGAAILLVAAWRLTSGDVMRDAAGLAKLRTPPAPRQLILLGGLAVLAGWILIRADGFRFREQDVISVLLVVVTMAVVWLASGGAGSLRWPVPSSVVIAGLAVVVALLALNWVSRILDELDEFSPVGWLGLVLHVGGAAALAVGAALGWMAGRTGTAQAQAGTPPPA